MAPDCWIRRPEICARPVALQFPDFLAQADLARVGWESLGGWLHFEVFAGVGEEVGFGGGGGGVPFEDQRTGVGGGGLFPPGAGATGCRRSSGSLACQVWMRAASLEGLVSVPTLRVAATSALPGTH